MLSRWLAVPIACMCSIVASPASSDDFPSKPVRILVGFAPGGGVDYIARVFADFLSRETKQQGIVENRTGAAGTPALQAVARATPDGYTLGVGISASLVMTPFIQRQFPVDVLNELTLIGGLVEAPHVVAVGPKVKERTALDFIQAARKAPGVHEYGSAGVGSLTHLSAALFGKLAGVQLVHVPFRGNAPAVSELIAGRISIVVSSYSELQAGVEGGTVRPLLAASRERLSYLPDVPTSAEAGIAEYIASTWMGLIGPAGMPPTVVDRLNDLIVRMMRDPTVQKGLAARHQQPMPPGRKNFEELVRSEYAHWKERIPELGIQQE